MSAPGSNQLYCCYSLSLSQRKSDDVNAHALGSCVPVKLQGSIMVASLLQILVGFFGIIGFLMRFIGPLTIAPTVSLIGLSLYDSAGAKAGSHWGISAMYVSTDCCGECLFAQLEMSKCFYCVDQQYWAVNLATGGHSLK